MSNNYKNKKLFYFNKLNTFLSDNSEQFFTSKQDIKIISLTLQLYSGNGLEGSSFTIYPTDEEQRELPQFYSSIDGQLEDIIEGALESLKKITENKKIISTNKIDAFKSLLAIVNKLSYLIEGSPVEQMNETDKRIRKCMDSFKKVCICPDYKIISICLLSDQEHLKISFE